MDKVYPSCTEAVADVPNGASLAVGGFGLNGIPHNLIEALLEQGATDLVTVSNNCGVDGWGLGVLLDHKRIRRTTGSYVGENKEFERQYLTAISRSSFARRGRLPNVCAPAAAAFRRSTRRLASERWSPTAACPGATPQTAPIAIASPKKETRKFGGRDYVLENGIVCDFALVRASVGDRAGNLIFHKATRNFNPLCAMAGKITIAEVEELVEPGEIDPEQVHLPGIFVQRVVRVGTAG